MLEAGFHLYIFTTSGFFSAFIFLRSILSVSPAVSRSWSHHRMTKFFKYSESGDLYTQNVRPNAKTGESGHLRKIRISILPPKTSVDRT
jgi:hypothetical protein